MPIAKKFKETTGNTKKRIDTMPFHPNPPLKPQTPGCPYCYDGYITWDEHSCVFHCSACQTIVRIHKWDSSTTSQVNTNGHANGHNGQANGHANGHSHK